MSNRRIGADIGFIAWQKPVTAKEMSQYLFRLGLSQQQVTEVLKDRYSKRYIEQTWRDAYSSRASRPVNSWRPKMMQSEARP